MSIIIFVVLTQYFCRFSFRSSLSQVCFYFYFGRCFLRPSGMSLENTTFFISSFFLGRLFNNLFIVMSGFFVVVFCSFFVHWFSTDLQFNKVQKLTAKVSRMLTRGSARLETNFYIHN